MRVLYYTRTSFLDVALSCIQALSKIVEVHGLVELTPESWQTSLFDIPPQSLDSGVFPVDQLLNDCVPAGVPLFWAQSASMNFAVHTCRRSIHPVSWIESNRIARWMKGVQPDIVHYDGISLRQVWGLPALGNVPVVASVHDPEAHSGERNFRGDIARRMTVNRVSRYILHSHSLLRSFYAREGVPLDRVDAIPLGVLDVYRQWIQAPVAEEPTTVLFFGRVSPYKGLGVLYEAAPRIAEAIPNLRLVVAGCPIRGYVPPKPPPLPQGGSVEVIERYIPNNEAAQLFQRAALVVCPYIDASQSAVVLTAYAFGKPVVATRTGGLPEYVDDGVTGRLVTPGNARSLAEAMTDLLEDQALRQRMQAGIRHKAANYLSWTTIANQTYAAYQRALDQSNQPGATLCRTS